MAALTFTAASVLSVSGIQETIIAGGTVVRGNCLRKNTSNQVVVTSNDSASNAAAYGIALADAAANQPVPVHVLEAGGNIQGVATNVAAGKPLVCGVNGAIIPVDDIAGGEFITYVGIGLGTTSFTTGRRSGVAAAGAVT